MTTPSSAPISDNRILVLEAFEHVRNDRVQQYLEMGQVIDDLVREKESGMLVHALTRCSGDETETIFRWLEVFENSDALAFHLNSDHVIEHVAKLNAGILSAVTDLVICADWDEPLKTYWQAQLADANLSFVPVYSGFYLER